MHLPKLLCRQPLSHQPSEALRVYTQASVCQETIQDQDMSRQVKRVPDQQRRFVALARVLPPATGLTGGFLVRYKIYEVAWQT
jgi:hypothetical protein